VSTDDEADVYRFTEQLEFGKRWEERAKPHLKRLLTSVQLSNVSHDRRPELQEAGIDHIVSKDTAKIDVKTYSHEKLSERAICIEVASSLEHGTPGWFWDTESDLMVVVYPNKAETNLAKTAYMMPFNTGVREWFREEKDRFDFARVPNPGYHTGVYWVPVDSFPDEFLVEFDPRLPTDRETPQSDLAKWTSGGGSQ